MITFKKPYGRSLADFFPLLAAEMVLRERVYTGTPAVIGDERPQEKTKSNHVRAEFLRFLALGGDEQTPIHENGIILCGAWITATLNLNDCHIAHSLIFIGCNFEETPKLCGTKIDGSLILTSSKLPGLAADNLTVKGNIFLNNGFIATNEVRLPHSKIGGNLECIEGEFHATTGHSILLANSTIQSSIFLSKGFKSIGEVNINGSDIGSNLECDAGNFNNPNGTALSFDHAKIKGSIYLRKKFVANGLVSLRYAETGGNLDCSAGCFNSQSQHSLAADHAKITGTVHLHTGFKARKTVRFFNTIIKGNVECKNAEFNNIELEAISFEEAKIQGSLLFSDNFQINGMLTLVNTQIGGSFAGVQGEFNNKGKITLFAHNMNINGDFILQKLKSPANKIQITSSSVAQLRDDEASWGQDLILDGFVYKHFSGNSKTDAQSRLRWLNKQIETHLGQSFKPQPWKQLILTLRNQGHVEDARQVAIAYEKQRYKAGVIHNKLPRMLHWVFGLIIDYGYSPLKLLKYMLLIWLLCGALFWAAALHGVFAPSNPLIFNHDEYQHCSPGASGIEKSNGNGNWYLCQELAGEYTGFSPFAYSLDLILPLVDLQQEHDWAPYIPAPQANWLDELAAFSKYHWTRLLVWFEILFGWGASLVMAAVLSGLTNRNDDN